MITRTPPEDAGHSPRSIFAQSLVVAPLLAVMPLHPAMASGAPVSPVLAGPEGLVAGLPVVPAGEVDLIPEGDPLFPGGTVYPGQTLYPGLIFTTLFRSREHLTSEQRSRISALGIETVEDFMTADPALLAPIFETDAGTVASWQAALRELPQER